jgi:hypothetical protein
MLGRSVFSLLLFVSGVTIRPYVPPKLDPEPTPEPSTVQVVEILPSNSAWDANILIRPSFVAPLAGHAARGARIAVRGELKTPNVRGCSTHLYYALTPLGWICSNETRPSNGPATTESVIQVAEGSPLPYRYIMVMVEEGSFVPMWASLEDLHAHAEPERQLSRGDTVAVIPQLEQFDGASYYISVDNKIVPVEHTRVVDNYSQWQGVEITADTHLPFGWVNPQKAPVYAAPDGSKVEDIAHRTRVDILEEQSIGKARWLRIGDNRWIRDKYLNEVRKIARPEGTGTHPQWFDVDLGEQVVVAYRHEQPVYATLTSSGREPNHTPRGNYPIWGKASAITMKSQDYDDIPYYVNRVPWVMFFQAHNALHGAYWHDRFGITKSHGCANLAPKDAHYLFDWLEPALPPGWTAIRYWDLTEAPVAHVHDTHKAKDMFQERNIGPPDKNDEAERLDKALARREAKEREEAAAAAAAAGGAAVGVAPAVGATNTATTPAPALQPTAASKPNPQPLAAPVVAQPKAASSSVVGQPQAPTAAGH